MSYWGIIASAASSSTSSLLSYGYNMQNADNVLALAKANSAALAKLGDSQAGAILAMGKVNAMISLGLGEMEYELIMEKAKFNAKVSSMIGDYNAHLLEDEARLIWNQADLDEERLEEEYARAEGHMQVGFGASGVIMDQDSPLEAIIGLRTQGAMDKFILRHNADIKAGKVLDAAARSRWEGNFAAQQMIIEGQLNAFNSYANRYLSAAGSIAQANISAKATAYNYSVQAWQALNNGLVQYSNAKNSAQASLLSGLLGTGSSTTSSILSSKSSSK
ncbi:MAG: hypothetical protein PVG39_00820 [Desulfobacteraceae bacterium]